MEGLVTALLLAVQVVNGNPVNQECCGSKTVGDYSYTRVDTSVGFPDACLAPCAYSRDDQPGGSIYCFSTGSLPVKCLGEKPEIMSSDVTVGPWGNYSNAKEFKNEHTSGGEVTHISIFTGVFFPYKRAVVGIAVTYGGLTPIPHGTTTGGGITETPCKPISGDFFGQVEGRSNNLQAEGRNLIFQLGFEDTSSRPICSSPATPSGTYKSGPTIPSSSPTYVLSSVTGTITDVLDRIPVIGSLTFHFKKLT